MYEKILMYLLCVIVATISFVFVYVTIKEKKKMYWMIIPIFMNMVIICVLMTQKISCFGILGILGVFSLLNIKKKNM
jgi:hypothetical protein